MRALLGVLIAGVLVAASACTPVPRPVPPTVDVSGNWIGSWTAFEGTGGSGELRGTFRQDGATLYGNFEIRNTQVNRTYVNGMVVGNEVRLFAPAEGTLVVNGDEMSGTVQAIVKGRIVMRRQP
ncbi:MAG TPA: hypothetical protein VMS64_31100 [Candidatus Methylomirabilis sp.]|nr:hypothetical protein [Candidatus Methylomirabilis sp.]